jgi:hypothetical protein
MVSQKGVCMTLKSLISIVLTSVVFSACSSMPAKAPRAPANSAETDRVCLVQYQHAFGNCNKGGETGEVSFDACLKVAKEELTDCCTKEGGSASCDADARE